MEKISKAPDKLVRAVLIALCDDSDVERKAVEYLSSLTAWAGNADSRSRKRKAESDIHICVQCKDAFYDDENVGKPCLFHGGMFMRICVFFFLYMFHWVYFAFPSLLFSSLGCSCSSLTSPKTLMFFPVCSDVV